jgi:hypothetical protein
MLEEKKLTFREKMKGSHHTFHFSDPQTGQGSGLALVRPHGRKNKISEKGVRKIIQDIHRKITQLQQVEYTTKTLPARLEMKSKT